MRKLERALVESVERQALLDLAAAARDRGWNDLGVSAEPVGDVLVLCSEGPGTNHPLLNRIVGLGFRAHVSEADVDALLAPYRRSGTSRFFVHLYDDAVPSELPVWLASRGIVRYRRSWNKLARGRSAPLPAAATRLSVRAAVEEDAAALGGIFAEAFDFPAAAGRFFAAAIGRHGWHALVASEGPRVVAGGLLFIADGVGYLAGGATAGDARGQGAQLALLAERCRIALEHGCQWIVSETGEAVAGDPQHSHRNLERCGLGVIATRHNYAPVGAVWQHGARA